jgi:hypothetical protein
MAVQTLEEQLTAKNAQLATLIKSGTSQVLEPVASNPITLEQIQAMIEAGVAKKMSELTSQTDEAELKRLTPLEWLPIILQPDEAEWLTNPPILQGINDFAFTHYIRSEDAKTALRHFYTKYREYHESKNKT